MIHDKSYEEVHLEEINKKIGIISKDFRVLLSCFNLGIGGLGILLALILWRVW